MAAALGTEVDETFSACWERAVGDTTLQGSGRLAREAVAPLRAKLGNFCFSDHPGISRRALNYLRRVLECSPIGDRDVPLGLLHLVTQFVDKLSPQQWGNLPLDISVRQVQCIFLMVDALRAEHLIGNLPALPQDFKDKVWTFAETLSTFNVHATGPADALDEVADVNAELWLELLVESAKRLKTDESKAGAALKTLSGAAGAAIKLYRGDVVAGLTQLQGTFEHNSLVSSETWFDELALFRKLASDAVRDEQLFRQLRWTIKSGSLFKTTVFSLRQRPRFLMHVILCFERLILEGATDYIQQETYSFLVGYAISDNMFLQYVSSKLLESLGDSDGSIKIKNTSRVVLAIVERTILSQSDQKILRNYAEQLKNRSMHRARPIATKAKGHKEKDKEQDAPTVSQNPDAVQPTPSGVQETIEKTKVEQIDAYDMYTQVIAHLVNHLNEGSNEFEGNETLVQMASMVTSYHASRLQDVLRNTIYYSRDTFEYFKKPTKDNKSTPVHAAARSGVRGNLEWMLEAVQQSDPSEVFRLVTLENGATGEQPIHQAGSVDALKLLLEHRADLDVTSSCDGNSILHTTASPQVVNYIVSEKRKKREQEQTKDADDESSSVEFKTGDGNSHEFKLDEGLLTYLVNGAVHTSDVLKLSSDESTVNFCGQDWEEVSVAAPSEAHVKRVVSLFERSGAADVVNMTNDCQQPPLHTAARAGNDHVVEELLRLRACLHQCTSDGNNAIFAAAQADSAETCRVLMNRRQGETGAIDVRVPNKQGQTALFFTGIRAFPSLIKHLEGQVNVQDDSGATALHQQEAGSNSDVEVMRQLIRFRGDVNVKMLHSEQTPIICAREDLSKVRLLLESGAAPDVRDTCGDPLFVSCVYRGMFDVVLSFLEDESSRQTLLLSRGNDGRDALCNTALFNSKYSKALVSTLIDSRAEPDTFQLQTGNDDRMRPISHDWQLPRLRAAVSKGLDLKSPGQQAKPSGRSVLHARAGPDFEELLQMGADACAVDSNGRSVIYVHLLKGTSNREQFQQLLDANANLTQGATDWSPVVAWAKAVQDYQEAADIFDLLVSSGCDLSTPGRHDDVTAAGHLARVWTPSRGKTKLELLLRARADPGVCDKLGRAALHHAVKGVLPLRAVTLLVAACPGAAFKGDVAGERPVDLAKRLGLDDVVSVLQKRMGKSSGATSPPDSRMGLFSSDEFQQDALLMAELGRHTEAMTALTDVTVEDIVEMRDRAGKTILHAALAGGSLRLVRDLLGKAPQLAKTFSTPPPEGMGSMLPLRLLCSLDVVPREAAAMATCLLDSQASLEMELFENRKPDFETAKVVKPLQPMSWNSSAIIGAPDLCQGSGKHYFEFTIGEECTSCNVGWLTSDFKEKDTDLDAWDTWSVGIDSLGRDIKTAEPGKAASFFKWDTSWKDHDVIGCAIDMDDGKMCFSHNGEFMPKAEMTFEASGRKFFPAAQASGRCQMAFSEAVAKHWPKDGKYQALIKSGEGAFSNVVREYVAILSAPKLQFLQAKADGSVKATGELESFMSLFEMTTMGLEREGIVLLRSVVLNRYVVVENGYLKATSDTSEQATRFTQAFISGKDLITLKSPSGKFLVVEDTGDIKESEAPPDKGADPYQSPHHFWVGLRGFVSPQPCLQTAIESGNTAVVQVLLERSISLEKFPEDTCIWKEVRDEPMVQLLLRHRASLDPPNSCNSEGNAINHACKQTGVAALRALLGVAGPRAVNTRYITNPGDAEDEGLPPPLHMATCRNMELLLQKKADPNSTLSKGDTTTLLMRGPLDPELEYEGEVAAKFMMPLIRAKALLNLASSDALGPLFRVYGEQGHADAISLLIKMRADVCSVEPSGASDLLACVAFPDCVKLIRGGLHSGGRTFKDVVDADGQQVFLTAAIESGAASSLEVLKILEEDGVNLLQLPRRSPAAPEPSALARVASYAPADVFEYFLGLALKEPDSFVDKHFSGDEGVTMANLMATGRDREKKLQCFLRCVSGEPTLAGKLPHLLNQRSAQGPTEFELMLGCNMSPKEAQLLLEADAKPGNALVNYLCNRELTLEEVRMMELLLQFNADINALSDEGSSVLHEAVARGDKDLCEQFIAHGADVQVLDVNGNSIMMRAAQPHMVSFLQTAKVDINKQSLTTGDTLVHRFAEQGNTVMVDYVLNQCPGSKIKDNALGQSLLHVATRRGRVETVRFLVEDGLAVSSKDSEGQTPLHLASSIGSTLIVTCLLERAAEVNATDNLGEPALFEAIKSGSMDVFELLHEHGASYDVLTVNKRNSLHVAAAFNRLNMIQVLLSAMASKEADIDVNQETSDLGNTPLHVALSRGHTAIVMLLLAQPDVDVSKRNFNQVDCGALAARQNAREILEQVMRMRPTFNGRAAFLEAVSYSSFTTCEYFLDAQKVPPEDCKDDSDCNCLHLVAKTGDDILAKWLLDRLGEEKAKTLLEERNHDGQTPFAVADVHDSDRVMRAFNVYLLRSQKLGQKLATAAKVNETRNPPPSDGGWSLFGCCAHPKTSDID